jgi:hypothetical protein
MCLVLLATAIAGSILSACGDSPNGPVQTVIARGQPIVDVAGTAVTPGEPAVVTAYVTNNGGPVTLVSAAPVPVPGYRAAALVDIGVSKTLNAVGVDYGWPPHGIPVKEFRGAVLPHGESRIIFGVSGSAAGANYAAAGIRITYRYRGQSYTFTAWSGVMACVTAKTGWNAANDRCNSASDKFAAAVDHVAGIS